MKEMSKAKGPLELAEAAFRKDSEERFLILGGGVAALRAAIAIRERNCTAEILMLTDEGVLPYSRPMLTKTPLRGFSTGPYIVHDENWYRENGIRVQRSSRVIAVRPESKSVQLANGHVLQYDKCIYALGAESNIPPIPGSEMPGVITVRRDCDIEKMRRQILRAKRAVVIGGGVIGLEIAWEIKKAGLEVTILEVAATLMERLLDEETAGLLEQAVREAGINVVTGAKVTGITGAGAAEGVALAGAGTCPADFVVLSAGIRPNVEPAKQGGIDCGRSVKVNARMETSATDLYACGDCAELEGVNSGTWTNACGQGYVAGANAAGDDLVYDAIPDPILVHAVGTALFAIGDAGKRADMTYEIVWDNKVKTAPLYRVNPYPGTAAPHRKYFFAEGKLLGAALLGDLADMQQVRKAVAGGYSRSEFFGKEASI